MKFIGNDNELLKLKFEYDNGYYIKTIRNKKTKKISKCYVNESRKTISFEGENYRYFLDELNGKIDYEN